jgi:DNA-binding Lrp family transcriptional regulator
LISDIERAVLKEVQNLPMVPRPFAEIGKRLGINEDEILNICRTLQNLGIIRSIGPSISHRKLGFSANPMTAVKVPEGKLDEVGRTIASEPEVTHCYARSGWDFNIFFMIHGKSKDETTETVKRIMNKVGNFQHKSYYSVRELKKVPFEIQDDQDSSPRTKLSREVGN